MEKGQYYQRCPFFCCREMSSTCPVLHRYKQELNEVRSRSSKLFLMLSLVYNGCWVAMREVGVQSNIGTKAGLHSLIEETLADRLLIVVSNREPYIHDRVGDKIKCSIPASGLTIALDPIMRTCGGIWIAQGTGDADREVVDKHNRIKVPPGEESYTLRRVWLTKEEEEGYYLGFSNEAIWPLCHVAYTPPIFDQDDWDVYRRVNNIFAEAVLNEIGDRKAFVFIQDYHLALMARMIKEKNPNVITALFWHIPWPNPEVFRICPWAEELLDGMLGNDLLGFHIAYHCHNFLETVNRMLESKIDYETWSIDRGGHSTLVRYFPISVDFERISSAAASGQVTEEMQAIKDEWNLENKIVGVSVDRIDYTKGIPHRLKALDRFLEHHSEYQGKLVVFQLEEPSRTLIHKYKELDAEIDDLVEEINWKYQSGSWKPIIYLKQHNEPSTIIAFNRLAHFCIVSSLHDGMNLVAKEFVSSRIDEDGVLILSKFTGSARELTDALLINPYATDHFAETIYEAIKMPKQRRRKRMKRLRQTVEQNNIYRWAGDIISELANIEL